jgi:mono/diheme cytochrome c family protein
MGSLRVVTILLLLGSPAFAQSPTYGVGRTPTVEEIRRMDISISPTGEELPPGRGTAKEGALVFEQKACIACHGATGLGGMAPALQSKKSADSHLGTGAHTATARAVCDDRVGFHQSRHACRE